VDLSNELSVTKRHNNIFYQSGDFENVLPMPSGEFDVLWCHDSFQYAQSPTATLARWWELASPGAMLYIGVPATQRIHRSQIDYCLPSGCYYHYTMVSLMYMLATAGWDCGTGFFKQIPTDPWIHAVVYKGDHAPQNPKTTTWHTLVELNLLPESAVKSIHAHNALRQQDLIVPWLDHSLLSMSLQ
jgi:SAM-dependent methyltransferase